MPASEYIRHIRSKVGHDVLEMPSTAVLVFNEAGKLLLMRDAEAGYWSLPGGLMEPGEVPADAAVREVHEETGVIVELEARVGVFGGSGYRVKYKTGDEVSFVMITFRGRPVGGAPRADGEESLEVGYFSLDEISQMTFNPAIAPALRTIVESDGQACFESPTWHPDTTPENKGLTRA